MEATTESRTQLQLVINFEVVALGFGFECPAFGFGCCAFAFKKKFSKITVTNYKFEFRLEVINIEWFS